MLTLSEAGSLVEVCKRFPVKKDGEKFERPLMVQAYLFFSAMISGFLRGVRYDKPISGTDLEDEKTVVQAVIRSIDKDNVPQADMERR